MLDQTPDPQPPTWEIWVEFLGPSLALAQSRLLQAFRRVNQCMEDLLLSVSLSAFEIT